MVEEERPEDGAVDRNLDRVMVRAFPGRSADELLRALPGLHQSAHGGQGKAFQVFLRGFDAEHGTAIAVDLEGVPLNEVDNVHGHGYLDLHLIPSQLVQGVQLHAGPARAEDGNFAVVGAASYALGLERSGLYVEGGGGSDRSGQGAAAWRPPKSEDGTFVVAEATAGLGAAASRSWRQVKTGLGYEHAWTHTRVRGFLLAYDGVFDSPGTLREDDLPPKTFYDSYGGTGGGLSRRVIGAALTETVTDTTALRTLAWGGVRQLELRQNFTGFLFDDAGDGTIQDLSVAQGGAALSGAVTLPVPGEWVARAGVQARHDTTRAGIDTADLRYQSTGTLLDATTGQTDVGPWAELLARPVDPVQVELGGRINAFSASVEDPGERSATAVVAAPSARVVLTPVDPIEVSASAARGIQSPESRAVVSGARAPITLASTYEVGLGISLPAGLRLRGAGFRTDLDDELVFDHTVARYVSGGTTRRLGATGVAEWTPIDSLVVLVDITYADGRFASTNLPIPFAPSFAS